VSHRYCLFRAPCICWDHIFVAHVCLSCLVDNSVLACVSAGSIVEEEWKVGCSTDVTTAEGSPRTEEGEEAQHYQRNSQVCRCVLFYFRCCLFLSNCSCYVRKQLLLLARLSHRNSVHPTVCSSVTRMDQSKVVQARITKFSASAAWKTLVSGTIKLFHKFEGGHPE